MDALENKSLNQVNSKLNRQWFSLYPCANAGKLEAVCEKYLVYQYEKAVAAEEERLQGIKRELEAENAAAQTKSAEEHMRQTLTATRAVLSNLNPADPVRTSSLCVGWPEYKVCVAHHLYASQALRDIDRFLDPCNMAYEIALINEKLESLHTTGLPHHSLHSDTSQLDDGIMHMSQSRRSRLDTILPDLSRVHTTMQPWSRGNVNAIQNLSTALQEQMLELKTEKVIALEEEDYDKAKILKNKISELETEYNAISAQIYAPGAVLESEHVPLQQEQSNRHEATSTRVSGLSNVHDAQATLKTQVNTKSVLQAKKGKKTVEKAAAQVVEVVVSSPTQEQSDNDLALQISLELDQVELNQNPLAFDSQSNDSHSEDHHEVLAKLFSRYDYDEVLCMILVYALTVCCQDGMMKHPDDLLAMTFNACYTLQCAGNDTACGMSPNDIEEALPHLDPDKGISLSCYDSWFTGTFYPL